MATFDAIPSTLTVEAQANGSVAAEVGGATAVTVGAGPSQEFPFSVESSATLTAIAVGEYRFARWTLSGGLACAGGTESNICVLPVRSVTADTMVLAVFIAQNALTVDVQAGGSVTAEVGDADTDTVVTMTVNAGSHHDFITVTETFAATLTATAKAGWTFAGWTLSPDGTVCAGGAQANPCVLATVAGATVDAVFEGVPSTLTVTARANGSVAAEVGGVAAVTVGAGPSQEFAFSVESSATLTAVANAGWAFTSWTLSDGLACAGGDLKSPTLACCRSARSPTTRRSSAEFELRPVTAWSGPGSVSASASGSRVTHTAVPYAPGTFENWNGAPCDGSAQPECDVSSVMASASLPTAVFRPFVVNGIKSLAFGLGYHGADPDHFRVSFQDASGAGFTPVPSLERLMPRSRAGAAFGVRTPVAVEPGQLPDRGLRRPEQLRDGDR